eukprot:COSAG01_NODE_30293_length_618_cov_26.655106_1_plen_23_part_01
MEAMWTRFLPVRALFPSYLPAPS